ncbi:hypothetical protein [Jeongeupia chitinilytica]|uniref:Uncharacterized protein n=1 Tax=Jeongeupia chitinilytica TaxID=1041641 RepID=A0ABQ3GYE6_9NEIS|nr:hypothetical protein [Jeongeupia chitinilytica]GHD58451.1 hypothetical protein GCM10007350_08340 [Jeongeupia chitinilytica]
MSDVATILEQLVDKPCRGARHGHGSFITAEFGAPQLMVREGIPTAKYESLQRRKITVSGQWHLCIYCCNWIYEEFDQILAHSESTDIEIHQAVERLDSLKLIQVEIASASGATTFLFEGGGQLRTTPYDSEEELWYLHIPTQEVLSIKGGGLVSLRSSTTVCGEEHWLPLEQDLTLRSTGTG